MELAIRLHPKNLNYSVITNEKNECLMNFKGEVRMFASYIEAEDVKRTLTDNNVTKPTNYKFITNFDELK